MKSLTLAPLTISPSLFQEVARAGIVNFTRGSVLTWFRLVRYRDTSWIQSDDKL